MSSEEFTTILNNSLEIAAARAHGLAGIQTACDAIRRKASEAAQSSASSRDRFVEPWQFSQTLNVPLQTVEAIAQQLRKFGVLRLWIRVKCPNHGESGDWFIETDRADVLRQRLEQSCFLCGQIHQRMSWDSIEVLYGLNLDDDEPEEFRFEDFFASPQHSCR
jgi:hypothetical protein